MVFALADELAKLVYEKGFHPRDIAIIAPYLDGAVRYSLTQAFKQVGLPTNAVRRRQLRARSRASAVSVDLAGVGSSRLGHFPDDVDGGGVDIVDCRAGSARAALVTHHLWTAEYTGLARFSPN